MKIRSSLKVSFIITMLLIGIATTSFFSGLAANYFEWGVELGARQSMALIARTEQDWPEDTVVQKHGFYVSKNWQLLPELVINNIEPPLKHNAIAKKVIHGLFLWRPEAVIFVAKEISLKGEPLYVAKIATPSEVQDRNPHIPHPVWIMVFGSCAMGVFIASIFIVIRSVTKPVASLRNWAKSLGSDELNKDVPDFKYQELNTLGEIIRTSLKSVQEGTEREKKFLSHASHELRTPIAVTRTNSQLLKKIMDKDGATQRQYDVLERIARSNKTMTDITDTLLWISRKKENLPESDAVNIAELVDGLVTELSYLLTGKSVELSVEVTTYDVDVALTPCRIVLTNLIRNAFQHTQEGTISIVQNRGTISIRNSIADSEEKEDLGFGLGLLLTNQLTSIYDWSYIGELKENSYQATICFESQM